MKRITLILLGALLSLSVFAQTADKKWALGLGYGTQQYQGELGRQWLAYFGGQELGGRDWTNSFQLSLARYLNPSFEAQLRLNSSVLEEYAGHLGKDYLISGNYFGAGLDLHYKLLNNGYILPENFFWQPYLAAGVGLLTGKTELTKPGSYKNIAGLTLGEQKNTAFAPYLGAGMKFRISDGFNVFAELGMMPTGNDKFDLVEDGQITEKDPIAEGFYDRKGGDDFLKLTMGVNIGLGKAKDSDGDGVPDKRDKCPNTPAGVAVDADGCPLDRDGDGVPDYKDDCPDTPGLASLNGCPDKDGDGIADHLDECPDVPGLKKFNGCPDTDGDGVPDPKDECPNTPQGCAVDAKGCPLDSDGDGVIDCQDDCPNQPGPKENKGCPVTCIDFDVDPVYFNFDKSDLRPEGIAALDAFINKLGDCKNYEIVVNGHTCSIGSTRYNQGLSERRAQSVVKYLISKGVSNAYIGSKGYGETQPAMPNTSRVNREKNRRAEVDLSVK